MSDTISKRDVKWQIQEWINELTEAMDMLDFIPSADTPTKTGTWIKVHGYATPGGDPVWKCSECGKGQHVYGIEAGSYGADIADHQWVACPNCGAIMVGEDDE